jgi:hypothetical protein
MATVTTVTIFPEKSEFERGVVLFVERDIVTAFAIQSL